MSRLLACSGCSALFSYSESEPHKNNKRVWPKECRNTVAALPRIPAAVSNPIHPHLAAIPWVPSSVPQS